MKISAKEAPDSLKSSKYYSLNSVKLVIKGPEYIYTLFVQFDVQPVENYEVHEMGNGKGGRKSK